MPPFTILRFYVTSLTTQWVTAVGPRKLLNLDGALILTELIRVILHQYFRMPFYEVGWGIECGVGCAPRRTIHHVPVLCQQIKRVELLRTFLKCMYCMIKLTIRYSCGSPPPHLFLVEKMTDFIKGAHSTMRVTCKSITSAKSLTHVPKCA